MDNKTGNNKTRLLFVCTGNICRSPLAHALFVKLSSDAGYAERFEVESAGTHGYHIGENADSRMRRTSAARGVPFSHRARHFTQSDLDKYDYIFAMDRGHFSQISGMAAGRDISSQLRMFREFDPRGSAADDVPDPYYGGQSGFDDVFDIVERTSAGILDKLINGTI